MDFLRENTIVVIFFAGLALNRQDILQQLDSLAGLFVDKVCLGQPFLRVENEAVILGLGVDL